MPKKATKKKVAKKAKPKAKAKPAKPAKKTAPAKKPVGEIAHFYEKISVAVLKLSGTLTVGNKIRIEHKDGTGFEQSVGSMQIEHQQVAEAHKGQSIGLKVLQEVKEGDKVYII